MFSLSSSRMFDSHLLTANLALSSISVASLLNFLISKIFHFLFSLNYQHKYYVSMSDLSHSDLSSSGC